MNGSDTARQALAKAKRLVSRAAESQYLEDHAWSGAEWDSFRDDLVLFSLYELPVLVERLEEETQLEHRLRMGPPSGRGALTAEERIELREIAEARLPHLATKRVGELILVALDVLEQTDVEIARLKAAVGRSHSSRPRS